MKTKKILYYFYFSVVLLLPTLSLAGDDIDLNISLLTSGNTINVQNAKDYLLRRYYPYSNSGKIRIENALISIITSNDTVPDTILDHNRFSRLVMDKLKGQKSEEEIRLSDGRTAAIFLTGILKIKPALPALVAKLNYVTPAAGEFGGPESFGPHLQYFPSAIAILLMGDTTVSPYLVDVVKKHPDPDTRHLAGLTMRRLLGNIKPFEEALITSSDSTEQQRLKDIIEYYRPR